jgi:maleate cis-trans isomerase
MLQTESGKKTLRLGVLYPGDGTNTQILHLDQWLPAHSFAGVDTMLEFVPSWGGHGRQALAELGGRDSLLPPAMALAKAGCHAIVWACTSGSFIGGIAWARDQAKMLTAETGLPATSATLAMVEAARAINARRADVLGAYPEPITATFIECLGDCGVRVVDTDSLDAPDGLASFKLDIVGEMERFSKRCGKRMYPVFLPDTALDTLNILDKLEHVAGRQVITASQACVWHSLMLLGIRPKAENAGSLFRLSAPAVKAAAR